MLSVVHAAVPLAPGQFTRQRWPPMPTAELENTTNDLNLTWLNKNLLRDWRHNVETFSSGLLLRTVSAANPLSSYECILLTGAAGLSLALARQTCPDLFIPGCVVPEALPAGVDNTVGPKSRDGVCARTIIKAVWALRAPDDSASCASTRAAESSPTQVDANNLSEDHGSAGGGSASCESTRAAGQPRPRPATVSTAPADSAIICVSVVCY